MRNGEGAEAHGAQYPTGNISSEDMDALSARAAKAPERSPEERERLLGVHTKSYHQRRWN